MEKKLNKRYASSHFFYFTLFATMFAFASVFLLEKGFDNTTIGLTLSLMSIATIALQTGIADYLDKNKESTLQDTISFILLLIILGSLALFYLNNTMLILLVVVLIFSLTQSTMPLLNSMAFLYTDFGIRINYGFARGMGSLSYALITVILGFVLEWTGASYLPFFYLLFALLSLISVRSFELPADYRLEQEATRDYSEPRKEWLESDKNMLEFAKSYQRLFVMMLGVVALFFGHVFINNFFIQVITPIGGTSRTMGIAIFIGTILELPAMLNFDRLAKRIPVHQLLKIAAVFFFAKHLFTYLAPNLWVIYFAQALQIGAFSIAYPALVEYTQLAVAQEDLVKGQSLLASAIALSNILSSFSGGILLDKFGVSVTLFIAVLLTVLGVVIVFLTVEDQRKTSIHHI